MNTSQEAVQPLMQQRQTVTASNPLSSRHMASLGLTKWPSFKYGGFLTTCQAWPAGVLVAQEESPGPDDTVQDAAHLLPPVNETCHSTTTVDYGTQTGNCAPTTSVESPTPEVTKEPSQSEKLKLVFGSSPQTQPFKFNFHPTTKKQPAVQSQVPAPATPVAAPLTLLAESPKPRPVAKPRRRKPTPVVVQAPLPEEPSPYDQMQVFRKQGGRSRHLAKGAMLMAELGDRIVMYTDGSAKYDGRRHVPRTAAVTYKRLYGGVGAGVGKVRAERWQDNSYGILGVHGANEAEVVAVAEALGTLEREVHAYVQSRRAAEQKADASSPRLLAFLFSDSDHCLSILDKMLGAMRKQEPYTKRDSTVEQLKANLEKLGEYVRSTDLEIRLEFHWVKSHSKVPGHDRADRLATEAFTTAKLYFAGHQLPTTGTHHEVADLNEMTEAMQSWRHRDSAASLTDGSSPSTRGSASDGSQAVTDESSVDAEHVESVLEASKQKEVEISKTSQELRASECQNPKGQPQIHDAGEHAAPPPLSDVYQTIADLKREFQEQRDEERKQSERMAMKLLEALEELKRTSHVATTLVYRDEEAESKPKREKKRKRDALVARMRRAGQRLRGFGRKSTAT